MTAVRVSSYVTDQTSVIFNIERRPTIGSAGTNLMTADQTAVTTGVDATVSVAISSNDNMWLDIAAVSGTPNQLTVTMAATV
jgi:hypothetical protein